MSVWSALIILSIFNLLEVWAEDWALRGDDRKWDHSRGCRISSGMKKSNICDNPGDGDKVVGETIGTCGGIRDVVGASTQRCGWSLYPKMLWEPLPKDVVDASWQMDVT
ncbi:hypothetical protein Tco_1371532 [Tanacetum coccineum]